MLMRILFVQLGRIGDMILATPTFGAVRRKFPDARIHVLAGTHNYHPIYNNPAINSIIIWDKSPVKLLNAISTLRNKKFDFLIDPKDHYSTESKIISKIVDAKTSIGYNDSGKKNFSISIPNEEENNGKHFTIRCLQALKHLEIPTPLEIPKPELFTSPTSENYVSGYIDLLSDKKLIVLNISASAEKKMWNVENWNEFLRNFDFDSYNVLLSYAPSEKKSAETILGLCPDLIEFKSRGFADVIALISKANLLITPDTALVHVASAFDIPLLGLYSGLDDYFAKFAPLCTFKEIVRAEKGDWGIKSIQTEQVVEAFDRISAII